MGKQHAVLVWSLTTQYCDKNKNKIIHNNMIIFTLQSCPYLIHVYNFMFGAEYGFAQTVNYANPCFALNIIIRTYMYAS